MLVTPKKGTACLTLTLVVDATFMLPLPNVNGYRSNLRYVALGLLATSQNQAGLRRFREGERRAASAVTNL